MEVVFHTDGNDEANIHFSQFCEPTQKYNCSNGNSAATCIS